MADAPISNPNGKDVLLVVVDCLRADHTISGGYSRKTTPFLTSKFYCFDQCVSAAPWTFPSVPSILSGLYPHSHGAVFTDEFRDWQGGSSPSLVADHVFTLPELLAKSGYEVFSKSAVDTSFVPLYGRFPEPRRQTHAKAETMIDDCIDWWQSTTGPKFGYIHLGDLHGLKSAPRVYPEGGERPFGTYDETLLAGNSDGEIFNQTFEGIYDTNLRYVDDQIKRLYRSIVESPDETLCVVVGDHGEATGEHTAEIREWFEYPRQQSGYGHGMDLFQESINVPLYINDTDSVETSQPITSTIDIVPTILNILDAQVDEPMDGRSLSEAIPTNRKVISQEVAMGYEQIAVIDNNRKLYMSAKNNIEKCLQLEGASETVIHHPTAEDEKAHQSLLEAIPQQKQSGKRVDMNRETESRLADLGYL
jgi:arylsulfatase A-like enzyme